MNFSPSDFKKKAKKIFLFTLQIFFVFIWVFLPFIVAPFFTSFSVGAFCLMCGWTIFWFIFVVAWLNDSLWSDYR